MFKQYSMSGVCNGYTTACCLAVATRPEAEYISIYSFYTTILLSTNKTPDYCIEKSDWECPGILQFMGCLLSNLKQMKHSI